MLAGFVRSAQRLTAPERLRQTMQSDDSGGKFSSDILASSYVSSICGRRSGTPVLRSIDSPA
jgi:hypothetical protein